MIDDHGSAMPAAPVEESLFGDVTTLIEAARGRVAVTVNAELTMLYWGIGRRIREDVLGLEKPEYGRAVVTRLAERLTVRYGRGYSRSALFRMVQFGAIYESRSIVATLSRQLTWSHFVQFILLEDPDERSFYETLAAREHWSVRRRGSEGGARFRRACSRGGVLTTLPRDRLRQIALRARFRLRPPRARFSWRGDAWLAGPLNEARPRTDCSECVAHSRKVVSKPPGA
jgi:hypothetical protein